MIRCAFLVLMVGIFFCGSAQAQLFKTKEELIQNYGEPANKNGNNPEFLIGENKLTVVLVGGKALCITYSRRDKNSKAFNEADVGSFLEKNGTLWSQVKAIKGKHFSCKETDDCWIYITDDKKTAKAIWKKKESSLEISKPDFQDILIDEFMARSKLDPKGAEEFVEKKFNESIEKARQQRQSNSATNGN